MTAKGFFEITIIKQFYFIFKLQQTKLNQKGIHNNEEKETFSSNLMIVENVNIKCI